MSTPLISVCIPVYNGAALVGETIASVQAQAGAGGTRFPCEILIQDNASTDATWDVLARIAAADPRVLPQRNAVNLGMAGNWNAVIDRARAPFVMLLSADDLLRPGFFASCLSAFARTGAAAVSANHTWLRPSGERHRRMPVPGGMARLSPATVLCLNPFSINFTVFRRDALDACRRKDGRVFAPDLLTCDYDLWLRLAQCRLRIAYLRRPLARYRVHGGNLSHQRARMLAETRAVLSSHGWLWREAPLARGLLALRLVLRRLALCVRT